jgi:hypothetical protein
MCAAAFVCALTWGSICSLFGIDGLPVAIVVFVGAIVMLALCARGFPDLDGER